MKKISLLFSTMVALLLLAGTVVSCDDDGVGTESQFTSFLVSPSAIELYCGESAQITVQTTPEYTFAAGELTYAVMTATPEGCVTVDQTGLVTATESIVGSNGSAIIVVNTADGANARYVDVKVYESNNIQINSEDLYLTTLSTLTQLSATLGGFIGESVTVGWESTDESVIKVTEVTTTDGYCMVEIVGVGETTIKAYVKEYVGAETEYYDEITITVAGIGIQITNSSEMTLATNETYQFEAEVTLNGEVDDTMGVEWYLSDANGNAITSDTTNSSVSSTGLFTAGNGTGSVYVSALVSSTGLVADVPFATSDKITIYVPIVSISLSATDPTVYSYYNRTYDFDYTVNPAGASDYTVVWSLETNSIATIDSSTGVVTLNTGVDEGVVTVVATAYQDDVEMATASTDLTFSDYVVMSSITITNSSISSKSLQMFVGDEATMAVTVLPAEADDASSFEWKVGNSSIISINTETGVITAKSVGETTLTVTATDGSGVSDSITVKVSNFVELPDLEIGGNMW